MRPSTILRYFAALSALLILCAIAVPRTVTAASAIAESTSDRRVDISDLSYMLSRWGAADTEADFNEDGAVNIFDLSQLLRQWGRDDTIGSGLGVCKSYPLTKQTGIRTIDVASDAELAAAITNAAPGDVIELADGTYYGPVSIIGKHGTVANPITLQSQNIYGARITNDPGAYTPQVLYISSSSYVNIIGLDITGDATAAGSSGAITGIDIAYDGSSLAQAAGSVTNTVITHNLIHDTRQAGIHVGQPGGTSSELEFRCNSIYGTGIETQLYGEGIYLGNGSLLNSTVHDVTISGNDIYQTGAEAIDVKAPSYNISVDNNRIHDMSSPWTGAVAFGVDRADYQDGNYLFEENYVYNISSNPSSPHNGNGIVTGHGTTTIRNNVMWDIEDRAIAFYERATTPTNVGFGNAAARDVHIYNNTLFNCGDECIGEHPLTIASPPNPSIRIATNNIGSSALTSDEINIQPNNYVATLTDFVGPTTGTADQGGGIGSGFMLAGSSAAINTAQTLPGFSADIFSIPRPSGSSWDFGAYEYGL